MSKEVRSVPRKKVWVVYIRYVDWNDGDWRWLWKPRNICDNRELARMAAKRWRNERHFKTREKKYEFTGSSLFIEFDMPDRPSRKRNTL